MNLLDAILAKAIAGTSGTTDYSSLENKPKINNVTLSGNKTSEALGIPDGQYIYDQLDTKHIGSLLFKQFSKHEDGYINFSSQPVNTDGLLNLRLDLFPGTILTDSQDLYIPIDFTVTLAKFASYDEEEQEYDYDELIIDEFTLFYKNEDEEEEEDEGEGEQTLIDKLLPYICSKSRNILIPVQLGDCICIEGRIRTSAECEYDDDVIMISDLYSLAYTERSRQYSRYVPPVPPAVAYKPSWADEDEEDDNNDVPVE